MKNLNNISNFRRVNIHGFNGDEHNGEFIIDRYNNGEFYLVIVSNGVGWDHVSVTLHRRNGSNIKRCPTFEEMQMIKDKVFDEDELVYQIHPREEDYINTHPYCLHLWKPNKCNIKIPPINSVNDNYFRNNYTYFEHDGIIVAIKITQIDGWQVARVNCFTKDGKLIKSNPSWDIMCEAKSLVFGDRDAAFQFMTSSSYKHNGLDIWYTNNLKLMPPLPWSRLVGIDKKSGKRK